MKIFFYPAFGGEWDYKPVKRKLKAFLNNTCLLSDGAFKMPLLSAFMPKISAFLFIGLSLFFLNCGGPSKKCYAPAGCEQSADKFEGYNIDFLFCGTPDKSTFNDMLKDYIMLPKSYNNDYRRLNCGDIYIFDNFNFYRIDKSLNLIDNINYKRYAKDHPSFNLCTVMDSIKQYLDGYAMNYDLAEQGNYNFDAALNNISDFQKTHSGKTFFIIDMSNRLPAKYNGFSVINNIDNISDSLYRQVSQYKKRDFVLIFNPPLSDSLYKFSTTHTNISENPDDCSGVPKPKNKNISFDAADKSFKWDYPRNAVYAITITSPAKTFVDTVSRRYYKLTKEQIDELGENEFRIHVKGIVNFKGTFCEFSYNELTAKLPRTEIKPQKDSIVLSFIKRTGSFTWNVNKPVVFEISESPSFKSFVAFNKNAMDNCLPSEETECRQIDNYARYANYYFRIRVNNTYSNVIGPLRMSCGEKIPSPCGTRIVRSCMFIYPE